MTSASRSTRTILDRATKILFLAALCTSCLTWADPPPLAAFARRPAIDDVNISPDGRYLLYQTTAQGEPLAVTIDRRNRDKKTVVVRQGETHEFHISWCDWANDTRVLCGLEGVARSGGVYVTTRLVAVNADGSDFKILDTTRTSTADEGIGMAHRIGGTSSTQFQDEVIDFTPAEPDTVLLQLPVENTIYPSVYELNIYTGHTRLRQESVPPVLNFTTDVRGNVRVGHGLRAGDTRLSFLTRLEGEHRWRLFAEFDALERPAEFMPLLVSEGNRMYAFGPAGAHQGLWELDLEGKLQPRLVSSRPETDIREPIFAANKKLLGVVYETDKPFAQYLNARANSVIAGAANFLPDSYNEIVDSSQDERVYILRSESDIDAGSYHLLDVSSGSGDLELLGTAYPELDPKTLGRMQSITYEARDGTKIPAYLTLPPDAPAKGLPLVVMAHDGPGDRDSWEFDYLRLFLVSRGYAVLQMNYRGSTGYGWEWRHAADQDWAGVTYDDISDGARWASTQSFADPKHVCILGRGFGGYAALLGAMRNEGLFQCAISIGGVSDLGEWKDQAKYKMNGGILAKRIGDGRKKQKADSPIRDAEEIDLPLLLVHGTHDWVVNVAYTTRLVSALKLKRKPHEVVIVDGAGHDFYWESDRQRLLQAVEDFLAKHLH